MLQTRLLGTLSSTRPHAYAFLWLAAERGGRCSHGGCGSGAAAAAGGRRGAGVLARAAAVHAEQRALLLRDRRHLAPLPQVTPACLNCPFYSLEWRPAGLIRDCRYLHSCPSQPQLPGARRSSALGSCKCLTHRPGRRCPSPLGLQRARPPGPQPRVCVEQLAAAAAGGAGPLRPLPGAAAGREGSGREGLCGVEGNG